MIVSESSPTNSTWRVVQYFYRNSVVCFQEPKSFCFENDVFLMHGLGKCEGFGEDSRHGIGHLDIQVGSCIFLNAFTLNHCMCT